MYQTRTRRHVTKEEWFKHALIDIRSGHKTGIVLNPNQVMIYRKKSMNIKTRVYESTNKDKSNPPIVEPFCSTNFLRYGLATTGSNGLGESHKNRIRKKNNSQGKIHTFIFIIHTHENMHTHPTDIHIYTSAYTWHIHIQIRIHIGKPHTNYILHMQICIHVQKQINIHIHE